MLRQGQGNWRCALCTLYAGAEPLHMLEERSTLGTAITPGFLALPRNEERARNTNGYWAGHVIGHGVD